MQGIVSVQAFEEDVAEGDGVVVAGEAEVAAGQVLARMGAVVQKLFHAGHVAVEDDKAVEFDADFRAAHGDFLEVPLADGPLVTAVGGDQAIDRAVGLAGVNGVAGGLFVLVVEDLEFAHAGVGGIAVTGVADGLTVVAALGEPELEPHHEVAAAGIDSNAERCGIKPNAFREIRVIAV